MKPVVDRLEEQTRGRLVILRLDIHEPVGRQIGAEHDFQYTPTFIFFDSAGNELWRTVGSLDVERVLDSLED